jgi:RNA polymerase sigma-70 factor (ECF subfamily)
MSATRETDPFRALYDANHGRVRGLLARLAGPQEADDLTQIVFAKAAEALPRFRGDAEASTWLYRIAANTAADWLRSRSAHEAKATVSLAPAPDDKVQDPSADPALAAYPISPEQELARKEMRACIRAVIGQLPQSQRSVLVLAELGGLSDDDIAKTLGIGRGNAKVRLHRGRAQLKKALELRCDFYRGEENELACEPKPDCGVQRPGCSGGTARERSPQDETV